VTRPSRSSMSTALLDRAVGGFSRRLDRRSLLRRSTFAATALVAAPADFVLRPRTAYAAVCRCQGQACACGSLCCDGYTEFCCTLTGSNGCPPGTVAAGWWKVDGSGFCGGAPRYYLDCNAQCGGCGCRGGICSGACSGTRCGCAWGDCNNRKSGCVQFRYGQCNQQIACLGPIVCRVVTCTPPWVFDGSCTTASRTDNNTANHTRPCLEAPFGGFDGVNDVGGAIRVVGWAIDQNRRDGVEARIFVDQRPMVTTMADLDRPDVGAAYPYYGPNHGFDITIDCEPGRHVVCVLAYDQGSSATSFIAFNTVEVSGPLGNVDGIVAVPGGVRVDGWVIDPRQPQQPAVVRLSIDGVAVVQAPTGVDRPDVVAGNPSFNPVPGYQATVPTSPGAHQVCLDLVYDSGRTARLGCSEVIV
jgi:hypothetical protein